MKQIHSFHIPVMGIGFTIDSPLKVAKYSIDSVISLVDDILIEKIRKVYSEKFEVPYKEITDKIDDFRAKRITSYLNLINKQVEKQFDTIKKSAVHFGDDFKEYLELLPNQSALKEDFQRLINSNSTVTDIKKWVSKNLHPGSIDVNIMTKLDKENYLKNEQLPVEYNDAHAALRGFANSDLASSIILSAGMNPRLYSYIEQFDDFYPDANGYIKKKVVLKVSDYRSALIQGKFLAKKGIWVSEYRIESGLNCGGHAFATNGFLMGPILAEFRDQKKTLNAEVFNVLCTALEAKNREVPSSKLPLKITAQGGVGTAEEHQFLLEHYQVDSVGWGTPFLLVPEATTVDTETIHLLEKAKEQDLYLSNISPLGVPFNSLKGNTKDKERLDNIAKNRPGSSCPKKYVSVNKEFTDKSICTASRQYQHLKIQELEKQELPVDEYQQAFNKITEKSCICVGLGTSALINNQLDTKTEGPGVSVCPGPNMAYFSKEMSLKEMVNHIYGKINVITSANRPHMFVKELHLYINYLKDEFQKTKGTLDRKQEKYFRRFTKNLQEGIAYYQTLFTEFSTSFQEIKEMILLDLAKSEQQLAFINVEIEKTKELV